jgi:hypothetical protein
MPINDNPNPMPISEFSEFVEFITLQPEISSSLFPRPEILDPADMF